MTTANLYSCEKIYMFNESEYFYQSQCVQQCEPNQRVVIVGQTLKNPQKPRQINFK